MTDFSMFDAYRRENTINQGSHEYCDVDHLLRFWREAKGQYLVPLFGDKRIIERPITYNGNSDELRSDMSRMCADHTSDIRELSNRLYKALDIEHHDRYDALACMYRYMTNALESVGTLLENSVYMPGLLYYANIENSGEINSYSFSFADGQKIRIQNGQKITRVWGQLAKMIGAEDIWERVRVAHSLVLNQKKLKGTLCLSIHPLDYATASDNDNGWSSCMSWRERGCYRMGTVEMMNSPMVICAYVRSDKQHMEIDGQEWNSKKWRAWIIVNKDLIVCNRHYPYHQPAFAKEACNWVRELVGEKYGWTYDDVHEDFYSYMDKETNDNGIELRTHYMYNDLGDTDIIGMLRQDKRHLPGYIYFSGKAECMVCGEEILPDTQGADVLECTDCYCENECYCDRCGTELSDEGDRYTDPDGDILCRDCWEERCTTCAVCEDTIWRDDAVSIAFPIYKNRARAFIKASEVKGFRDRFLSWNGRIHLPDYIGGESNGMCLCENCASKYNLATVDYDRTDAEEQGIELDCSLDVLDPTKIDVNDAFDLLNPDGWYWAQNYGKRHSPEEAEELTKFWTDQWEAFKEDFKKAPLVDD